jgi:hypothetical protein
MLFGTIKRAKPRLVVLRGFDPNEPRTRTYAAPVSAGVTVFSGQVISLSWVGGNSDYEWILGGAAGTTPHLALQDSEDPDVVDANSLVGLSCSGQFELRTGYYSAGTYNIDTPLTYDTAVPGNVIATTVASTLPIIGLVTRIRGPINLNGTLEADQMALIGATDSSATNANVIDFVTQFAINPAGSVL